MNKLWLLIVFALVVLPLVQADCKSFINGTYPLGLKPYVQNLSITHVKPDPVNATFTVYVEGDATSGDLGGCRVQLAVSGELNGTALQIIPERLETGLGWKEAVITLVSIPQPPFGNSIVGLTLTDVDNPRTNVTVPLVIENRFVPPVPTLAANATISPVTPAPVVGVSASPTPKSLAKRVEEIGQELEESSNKYLVAIIAVVFLGALLWVGFKTLQRD